MNAAVAAPVRAYIALGANLGDAPATVHEAMNSLDGVPETHVLARSSLYRTAPIDSSGPDYVNAVVAVDTHLSAVELLRAMQQIELQAGRERPYRNAPRTLDLDLLMYGDLQQDDAQLILPHPRMMQRAFVLVPLHEIAPGLVSDAQLAAVAEQGIERIPDGA
ncbi:MAG: 2-amino-4-hydroxy-6-hydroxymethyldihydropteridine diphosphokinase [Brachymonas denitrificans]|uniref:2-amino-4-hydroxy-6- hydroxymethyldihydropteridine diphosphokinase n=1 Tax=Brachymonas denitrificans TaxID=28220 RepID=UPI001BCFCB0C|nr:2-amino-4-hydroxy-6-hydroxymethyldihydropteridine diphosphokinase [Brachymonas denitrificans]